MKVVFMCVLMLVSLTACQKFVKEAGETTKQVAKVAGDAGNELGRIIEDTIERNKD